MLSQQGTDPTYEALRTSHDAYLSSCRNTFLGLWDQAAAYLDSSLPERASADLHSAFWEMHVAAGLLAAGAQLVPRVERVPKNSGPDLLSARPHLWVEATTVTPGLGADAVPDPPHGQAYSVPDDQILLRITQAIAEKRKVHDRYLARGWLKPTDPYVIAVNSGLVPNGKAELPLPRIVRAVFPFGHYAVTMNRNTAEIVNRYYQYRPEIRKSSGSPVSTAVFEDKAFAGVSACLYSTTDAFNPPRSWSGSLILVHNPLARAPLARDLFAEVREYWMVGEELQWRPQ